MQKRRKTFLTVILLCVVTAAAYAFYLVNKPHSNVEAYNTDIKLSAENLYKTYIGNEAEADKKYLNKVLEVTGRVSAYTSENNKHFILLKTDDYGGVNCEIIMADEPEFKSIIKNKEVVIKGRCTGFLIDVNLTDCIILK